MATPIRSFWLPKRGNSDDEYEDAFAVSDSRFAVADGASESSFADRWARALVGGFVASWPPDLEAWLGPLRDAWRESIHWDRLPWFAVDKARLGAAAALLGLEILPPPSSGEDPFDPPALPGANRWRAMAVGDSCLFLVRRGALAVSFPVTRSDEFGVSPPLILSTASGGRPISESVKSVDGDCEPGDSFILATDALSCWFLREVEGGGRPWEALAGLESQEAFAAWISDLRRDRLMRNDDVTLLRVEVEAEPAGEAAEDAAASGGAGP